MWTHQRWKHEDLDDLPERFGQFPKVRLVH